MDLLVLGGTRFVGRAVVATALARGDDVTVVSRGESGGPPPQVDWLRGDRSDPAFVSRILQRDWDAVIDTWSGAPEVVARTAAGLAERTPWYGYVSSRSVYRWPIAPGADETAPTFDPDERSIDSSYALDKRESEIAVSDHFDGRCLLARAGLVLGPHEDTGRLTWWLSRAAAGGWVVAPNPRGRVWQCIDARDLAGFMLTCADNRTSGAYNVVGPRDAGVTTERLLTTCIEATGSRSQLVWVDPEVLNRAGIGEWDDLPGWAAPTGEIAALHDCDVTAAIAAGLSCRTIEETVTDTWAWLREVPAARRPPRRVDLPRRGLTAEHEQAVWWLLGNQSHCH